MKLDWSAQLDEQLSMAGRDTEFATVLGYLGRAVAFSTNSRMAFDWCVSYLAPFFQSVGYNAYCQYCALYLDPAAAADITPPPGEPQPLRLHLDKTGQSWAVGNGVVAVREDHTSNWYVIDRVRRRALFISGNRSADALQDPARMVRDIVLHLLARDGYLALHASAAVIGDKAIAVVGEKRAGKTTLLMHMLQRFGAAYVSNDKLLVKATASGGATVYGVPISCTIGVGTMRSFPALRRHLHAWENFEARNAPQSQFWTSNKKIEFTPADICDILGCPICPAAPLAGLVFSKLDPEFSGICIEETAASAHQDLLRLSLRHPDDRNYPDWMQIDGISSTGWGDALDHSWRQLLGVPSISAVAGSNVPELLDGLLARLLPISTEVTPSMPDPRRWPRRTIGGRWVAIMDHRRRGRGMSLAPWSTRAIRTGEIHEFVATPSDPLDGGRVDDVIYLGFAELEAGIIAVGDHVFATGREIGHVLGFDETHAPNHLNIIVASTNERTGLQLGLGPGQRMELRPTKLQPW
jgi:hypothetical protein